MKLLPLRTVAVTVICTAFAAVAAAALQDLHVDARDAAGLGGTYTVPPGTYGTVAVTNIDSCHVAAGPGVVVEGAAVIAAPQRNGTVTVTGGRYAALWIGNVTHPDTADDTTSAESGDASTDAASVTITGTVITLNASAAPSTTTMFPSVAPTSATDSVPVITALRLPSALRPSTANAYPVRLRNVEVAVTGAVPANTSVHALVFSSSSATLIENVTVKVAVSTTSSTSTGKGPISRQSRSDALTEVVGLVVGTDSSPGNGTSTENITVVDSRIGIDVHVTGVAPPSVIGIHYSARPFNVTTGAAVAFTLNRSFVAVAATPSSTNDAVGTASALHVSAPHHHEASAPVSFRTPTITLEANVFDVTVSGHADTCQASHPIAHAVVLDPSLRLLSEGVRLQRSTLSVSATNGWIAQGINAVAPFDMFPVSAGSLLVEDAVMTVTSSTCPSAPTTGAINTVPAIGVLMSQLGLTMRNTTVKVIPRRSDGRAVVAVARSIGVAFASFPGSMMTNCTLESTNIVVGQPHSPGNLSEVHGLWFLPAGGATQLTTVDTKIQVSGITATGLRVSTAQGSSYVGVTVTSTDVVVHGVAVADGISAPVTAAPFFTNRGITISDGSVDVVCFGDAANPHANTCSGTGVRLPALFGSAGERSWLRVAPTLVSVVAPTAAGVVITGGVWELCDVTVAPTRLIVKATRNAVGVNVSANNLRRYSTTLAVTLPDATISQSTSGAVVLPEGASGTALAITASSATTDLTIEIGTVTVEGWPKGTGITLTTPIPTPIHGLTQGSSLTVIGSKVDEKYVSCGMVLSKETATPWSRNPARALVSVGGLCVVVSGASATGVSTNTDLALDAVDFTISLATDGQAVEINAPDVSVTAAKSQFQMLCSRARSCPAVLALAARVPVSRPISFANGSISIQGNSPAVLLTAGLSSEVTFTNMTVTLATSSRASDSVAVLRVLQKGENVQGDRHATTLTTDQPSVMRFRVNGGAFHITARTAPSPPIAVVEVITGSASGHEQTHPQKNVAPVVSAVFASSFSTEPSHIGRPVVVTVNNGATGTTASLVRLPWSSSARMWANIDGPQNMTVVGRPAFASRRDGPQRCVPTPGTPFNCDITVVKKDTSGQILSLRSAVFRKPDSVVGFVPDEWALPMYNVSFETHQRPIEEEEFAANIALFTNVPRSSVRAWYVGASNATFVVNGPMSKTAYDTITYNPRAFAVAMHTSTPIITGGSPPQRPAPPPPPPNNSVPMWAIAAGAAAGGTAVVAAIAVAVVLAIKKRRPTGPVPGKVEGEIDADYVVQEVP